MVYFSPSTTRDLIDRLGPGRSYRSRQGGGDGKPLNLMNYATQAGLARSLARIANHTPEAVMKHTGTQKTAAGVVANLEYISRESEPEKENVAIEDERGRTITDPEEMRAIAKDWEAHELSGDDRRKGAVSRSLVLSSPPDSDPKKIKDAAREWAQRELGDRRYVIAVHNDPYEQGPHMGRANVHAHITYAIRDNELRRTYFKAQDLQLMREAWAKELRSRGIEVKATRRKARGVVKDKETTAEYRQQQRPERAPKAISAYLAKQRDVTIGVFRSAINDLKGSKQPDAAEIASSLSTFVNGLEADIVRERGEPARVALPERVLPSQEKQIDDEIKGQGKHREQSLDRDVDEAGRSPPDRTPEREASAEPEPITPDRDGAQQAPPERSDGLEREPELQPGSPAQQAGSEVVRLGNEYFDLADYSEEEAEILREVAEEERQRSIIELAGEEFDARDYDEDFAKELRDASKREKEREGKNAKSTTQVNRSTPNERGPIGEVAAEIERDLEKRIKDRERDREGPTR